MRVLAAPHGEDPRAGGFVFTVPGELVTIAAGICDTPSCGCSRAWIGLTSYRASTLAVVEDRPLDRATYTTLITGYYRDRWGQTGPDAAEAGAFVVDLAGEYPPGTYLGIDDEGVHLVSLEGQ